MNEKQFLEMDNRERDAWIETSIMGGAVSYLEKELVYTKTDGFGKSYFAKVPEYSTDYNAMMRVVERMEQDRYCMSISRDVSQFRMNQVLFTKIDQPAPRTVFSSLHNDLIIAVYLAAGRALGKISDG